MHAWKVYGYLTTDRKEEIMIKQAKLDFLNVNINWNYYNW